jgi:hypothetical protein
MIMLNKMHTTYSLFSTGVALKARIYNSTASSQADSTKKVALNEGGDDDDDTTINNAAPRKDSKPTATALSTESKLDHLANPDPHIPRQRITILAYDFAITYSCPNQRRKKILGKVKEALTIMLF